VQYSLMFFSSEDRADASDKYALLKRAAQWADDREFRAIWTPERHFHSFGGLFPNPALMACALATMTKRIGLRAGSLISPLHDVLRIAEEWSVADNLSGGRVAVSFGAGWNAGDFVFFPERYQNRQDLMYEQIELVGRLWRGHTLSCKDPSGKAIEVAIHPRPLQPELPLWITSSGSVHTFIRAGAIGANILTHMLGQDIGALADKIRLYRQSRLEHGFDPDFGVVSLMLHTFVGTDSDEVYRTVRGPLREYLRSAVSLERSAAAAGGVISGGKVLRDAGANGQHEDEMLELAFERYFNTAAFMGTAETCCETACRYEEIGVNEIACLIDFGVDEPAIWKSLHHLEQVASPSVAARHDDFTCTLA